MSAYLQQAEAYAQHQAQVFTNDYLVKIQQDKVAPRPSEPAEPRRSEEDRDKVFQVYRIVNLPVEALKAQM